MRQARWPHEVSEEEGDPIAHALNAGDTGRARRLLEQHTSAILRRLGLGLGEHELRLPQGRCGSG
ncbi:hypothetical protein MOV08_37105 [Streptomyces yunnanensis]|uniref:FCD domain-containing protein n=1 Tax=Streptomyces yunnanensis TaxID=156453 RepID=A0ABY8AH89_9ACTN|nr:hypothetical protein [Streptomyces yunnanensis]WEB44363.1 hypothetical protein MOV08_37105 [Streptomyces yunnanensis]